MDVMKSITGPEVYLIIYSKMTTERKLSSTYYDRSEDICENMNKSVTTK